jgi:hypothetical protein
MVAAAPMAVASASFSAVDAAAMTRAPRAVATSMAASPTPPPAPSTSTVSPGVTVVRRVSANHAVQ